MATLICPQCGAVSAPGVRFCGRCGTPLPSEPVAATAPSQRPVAAAGGTICPHCGAANAPAARFCGRCAQPLQSGALPGAPSAATAAPPTIAAVQPTLPPTPPRFTAATPAQLAQVAPRKARRGVPWGALVGVVGVVAVALAAGAQLVKQQPAPVCGVSCPQPIPPIPPTPPLGPAGPPLPPQRSYTSSAAGFSVEYPDSLSRLISTNDSQTIGWSGQFNDGGSFQIVFHGEAANGRTPQQLVQTIQQSQLGNNATLIFALPDTALGYMLGYGAVYDVLATPQGGQQQDLRVAIEATVRNGTAVEMLVASPFTPDHNEHPSPAQLDPRVESMADVLGNTVTWPGESPL